MKHVFRILPMVIVLFALGCGSNESSSTYLRGGSVQGRPLTLTGTVTTLAGTAGTTGSTDAIGTAARFNGPMGVTTDGTNLYLADTNNHTIRKIVISTGAVTTLAGTAGSSGSTDGVGAAARFNTPTGITTDGRNLYVTDYQNNTIRQVVIATGTVTTVAGTAGTSGSTDATGAAARFNGPAALTTDGTSIYVSDNGNNTVRKIVIATGAVTTIAGTAGTSGSTDAVGPAARFNGPDGITTDGSNIYVIDIQNHTVRKIVISTGAVTTLAGTPGVSGSADGVGAVASFDQPSGVTTDGTNLYLADTFNHTVRKIVISTGTVTTLAGTAGTTGSTDAVGAAARFNDLLDLTNDGLSLYVNDSGNNTIRRIQ